MENAAVPVGNRSIGTYRHCFGANQSRTGTESTRFVVAMMVRQALKSRRTSSQWNWWGGS